MRWNLRKLRQLTNEYVPEVDLTHAVAFDYLHDAWFIAAGPHGNVLYVIKSGDIVYERDLGFSVAAIYAHPREETSI